MWWIIGFFAFITLVVVIPTMRMSSLCSREEEIALAKKNMNETNKTMEDIN